MEQSTHEEWRTIPGFEGVLEASSDGRIRSLDRLVTAGTSTYWMRGVIRRTHVLRNGYEHITIKAHGRQSNAYVHRLVASAFHGVGPHGCEVMHGDGDKLNNRAENLSWGSRSANMSDQVRHGTHANATKTHCPQGHEYTPENIYARAGKPNWRECRTCIAARIARRGVNRPSRAKQAH